MNENDLRQAFALMLTVGLGIDNADMRLITTDYGDDYEEEV